MSRRMQLLSRSTNGRTFALERFAWGAPDRLELAGTFSGLDEPPAGLPVLVLTGPDRTHRLPAAARDVSGTPENGRPWSAAFVWQEPPAAFDAAVLRLGSDLAVELPDPGSDGESPASVELPVRSANGHGADRVRLEAELLAGREELREARSALHRAEEELSRAREDLHAEREERAADAVRFRAGLAQVREAAEQALTAKDAELADVRGELEVATAFRAEAESASKAETAALRERMDEARRRLRAVDETLRET
jgi:hypothetical protein